MKKIVKYAGIFAAQGAAAFALAVFLIGPVVRGEPFFWQKNAQPAQPKEHEEEQAAGEHEDKSSEEKPASSSSHDKEKKEKKKTAGEMGALLPIESVIVNVAETQGRRFLKASLTLELDGAGVEEVQPRVPVLRGSVIDVLASKNLDQLVAPDAREMIRGEILQTLNSKMGAAEFKDLYFTEFIVQ
ncbi:MAG TPA: flagellar basal body-associated FliL family protein [bacterium]|nr:flagellar basal body-associated FliL family protein [bacterium]